MLLPDIDGFELFHKFRALPNDLARDHDVTMLTDPRQALRLIEGGEEFDLVMCDLMMPDMTGMDLHAELAAREFLDAHKAPSVEKPIDLKGLTTFVDARLQIVDEEAPHG